MAHHPSREKYMCARTIKTCALIFSVEEAETDMAQPQQGFECLLRCRVNKCTRIV